MDRAVRKLMDWMFHLSLPHHGILKRGIARREVDRERILTGVGDVVRHRDNALTTAM
jgi:hypothetical protein